MTQIGARTTAIGAAYAASQSLPGTSAAQEGGTRFAELLGQAVGAVADSGRAADTVSAHAATGVRTDLVDVVTAVAESQAALETLVSVRDKVISAYDEIMRMPI